MKKVIFNFYHSIIKWNRYCHFILLILVLNSINSYSQSNPIPFNLSDSNYTFTNWPASSAAGTYPANMKFQTISTPACPDLSVEPNGDYSLAYNLTATYSRISGLDANGFSFLNIGSNPYLGVAVLALKTTGRTNIQVIWTGGTTTSASGVSVYAIRLQYRIAITGIWTDVIGPVEYMQNTTGHSQVFGPTTLPSICDNNAVVQLRWKYYCITAAGTKPKLRVDEISVTSSNMTAAPTVQASNVTFTNVSTTSFKINWTNGNGANRILLIKKDSVVNSNPVNNNCYIANPIFGSGTPLGSGNYCVLSDATNTTTVTGLTANTIYHIAVYEYNGSCPGSLISYLVSSPAISSQLTSAVPSPTISTSLTSLPDFGSIPISNLGNIQSFTASGSILTNNITITPPSGFELSLSNSPFASTNPITLTKDVNGTINTTSIYVRFSPTLVKGYADTVKLISSGAISKYVLVTGKGVKTAPSNHITLLTSTLINPFSNTIMLNWNDATGTNLPDAYLIKGSNVSYAAISNPIDGVLPSVDLFTKKVNQGIKTVTFTGLNSSTFYYYKIFPYTNTGTDVKFKIDGVVPTISLNTIANGSMIDPLSCMEAIQNNSGTNIWVKGYIVGSIYSATSVERDSAYPYHYDTNLALADSTNEIDVNKMFFVKLPNTSIRQYLNLLNNHGNYHKKVIVQGDLMIYYTPHEGMQNTTDFKWFDSPMSNKTGSWNNAYTWTTGIPGINDDVNISSNVFVDAVSTCNKVTILPTGRLTIGLANTLSIVDSMNIEDGGSFIDYNNQNIKANVKRNFKHADWLNGSDGWHSVSSPVINQTINGNWLLGDHDFYSWDEITNVWLNQNVPSNNITSFLSGTGYFAAYASDTNKQFRGILNKDDVLVNLSYTSNGSKGYNLLGNPYPSAIRWNNDGSNNWNLTNVETIAKIWCECNQTYSQVFNNDIIPSNQGFFVKAISQVNGFVIPKASRLHDNHIYYKSKSLEDILVFNVTNYQNECKVSNYILFNPSATFGYDLLYESTELQGSSIAPRLYSKLSTGEKLSVNALPIITSNKVVDFGFVAGVNGIYTIKLDNNNVSNFVSIILKDLKTDSIQDLLIKPNFIFYANITDNSDRFKLFLNVTSTVGIDYFNKGEVKVLINDKIITVNSTEKIKNINIFSTNGQEIYNVNINNLKYFNFNLDNIVTGIYFVRIITEKNIYTRKIVLK